MLQEALSALRGWTASSWVTDKHVVAAPPRSPLGTGYHSLGADILHTLWPCGLTPHVTLELESLTCEGHTATLLICDS